MSRFELTAGWTAGGHVAGVQAALNGFFRRHAMWVVGEQDGEVHARQGWWPARLLGPRLTPSAWLPKLAVVRLQDVSGGVAVRVRIAEDSGIAQMSDRLADKYRGYFVRWVDELKARLK